MSEVLRSGFPTMEAVEAADITSLTRWVRYLPTASNEAELKVINRATRRYSQVKQADPDAAVRASKAVGW